MTILTPVARLPLVTTELDVLLRQVARRDVEAFSLRVVLGTVLIVLGVYLITALAGR